MRTMRMLPDCRRLSIYTSGIKTDDGARMKSKPPKGVKRGKIKGWSFASRRRMREWMLTHKAPEGWELFGLTLTIPGPIVEIKDAMKMWKHFCHNGIQASGWGMIWRIELQKRGQPHWHALVVAPACERNELDLKLMAENAIDYLGGVDEWKGISSASSRMCLPYASSRAIDIRHDDGEGAWLRYLQDHATKRKQAQIADEGRQWGVVGRVHFQEIKPIADYLCTDEEFSQVMRFLRRLFRPSVKTDGIWGWKHGRKSNRGRGGKSVWFSEASKRNAVARYLLYLRNSSSKSRIVHAAEDIFQNTPRRPLSPTLNAVERAS